MKTEAQELPSTAAELKTGPFCVTLWYHAGMIEERVHSHIVNICRKSSQESLLIVEGILTLGFGMVFEGSRTECERVAERFRTIDHKYVVTVESFYESD